MASQLREHGRSALLIQTVGSNQVGSNQKAERDAPFLSTIPDAICLLDYDRSGRDLERTIQVLKMRGSPHVTEKRELHIEQGGLRIEHLLLA